MKDISLAYLLVSYVTFCHHPHGIISLKTLKASMSRCLRARHKATIKLMRTESAESCCSFLGESGLAPDEIAGVLQAPCTLYREPEFINYRTIIVHFGASLTPVEASSD